MYNLYFIFFLAKPLVEHVLFIYSLNPYVIWSEFSELVLNLLQFKSSIQF